MKALLMAGGKGTRFWPLSVEARPKQFLRLTGDRTLLQSTFDRLLPILAPEDIFLVTSPPYVEETRRQVPELPAENIIVEPAARNTAPCIGWASLQMRRRLAGDEVVAVLPADHVIPDAGQFCRQLEAAELVARAGWLVVFGIQPSYPATGFGYIEQGEPLSGPGLSGSFRVRRFVEKPPRTDAERMLAAGTYTWNSGVFIWRLDRILEEIQLRCPSLASGLEAIPQDFSEAVTAFSELPSLSIDYAVMEQTDRAALLPATFTWNDVGSWKALSEVREADPDGLILEGRVVQIGSRDSIILAGSDRVVGLVGVCGLVVVETPGAMLIASSDRVEEVKQLVERLRHLGWTDVL